MKYALIGCGHIAANHIKAVSANKLDFIAACDVIPDNIEKILTESDLQNKEKIFRYTDYKTMLSDHPELELIAITTSSGNHAKIALDCIDSGKNLIIEKPMAMSIKDANEIIKRSKEKNVIVSVSHQNRFNHNIQKVRQALDEGKFGKLSHGSICVRWNRNKNYYNQAKWRGTWLEDGGCLMNQCIHAIDLLIWRFGSEVESVFGIIKKQIHVYLECEDLGMAILTFKNGVIATIEGTTNVYPKNLEETLCIFGEKGTVKLGGTSINKIEVWNFEDESMNKYLEETSKHDYINNYVPLYADVVDSIKNHRKPYIDAVAGRNSLEIVLAIYKSSIKGEQVKLPLTDCSTSDFADIFK